MPTIYILLCEKDRYYVGKTERPINTRVEEHFNKCGSEWTRKYKPLKVIEVKKGADEFDEDKYTKIYMKKYGINKVRGGTYTQLELPSYQLRALERELCTASNLCFRCNRPGHFADTCFARTKADGSPIEEDDDTDEESQYDDCWSCNYCNKEFDTEYDAHQHELKCKRKTTNSFIPTFFDTAFTALRIAEELFVESKPKKHVCGRCGRHGHFAYGCYASTHVDGSRLY